MSNKTTILRTFLLIIASAIGLFPFYMMLVMSTHDTDTLNRGISLLPGSHLWENLASIIANKVYVFFFNSLYISVITVIVTVLISALAGFALAKYDFKLKKPMFLFILATMMVPTQLGLIAFVLEMKTFGLINTHIPLIVAFAANPFGVFWMTQYIKSAVPNELLESARIDGCNDPRIFASIVVPTIFPAIVTLSLLVFMWSWNTYLIPLVTLTKPELYTLPVGIATLNSLYRTEIAPRITALAFGTLPMIVLFILCRKYFISGLMTGAIKG